MAIKVSIVSYIGEEFYEFLVNTKILFLKLTKNPFIQSLHEISFKHDSLLNCNVFELVLKEAIQDFRSRDL